MQKKIKTEIIIHASSQKVWAILTHFPQYTEWNPFIKRISGSLGVGDKLSVRIETPDSSTMNFSPVVKELIPEHLFVWQGKFMIKGLFDGEHRFILEDCETHIKFIHEEVFTGILVSFFPKSFFEKIQLSFQQMNLALKQRSEASKQNLNKKNS
jgi:hypothetical protein